MNQIPDTSKGFFRIDKRFFALKNEEILFESPLFEKIDSSTRLVFFRLYDSFLVISKVYSPIKIKKIKGLIEKKLRNWISTLLQF